MTGKHFLSILGAHMMQMNAPLKSQRTQIAFLLLPPAIVDSVHSMRASF